MPRVPSWFVPLPATTLVPGDVPRTNARAALVTLGRRLAPAGRLRVERDRRHPNRIYNAVNGPIVPEVDPETLPVIVLLPRVWTVPLPLFETPWPPLFANTQFE